MNTIEKQNINDISINDYRNKLYKLARKPNTLCIINKSTAAREGLWDRWGGRLKKKEEGVCYSPYIEKQIAKYENKIKETYSEMERYHAYQYAYIEVVCKETWQARERLNCLKLKVLSSLGGPEKGNTITSEHKREIMELRTALYKNKRDISEQLSYIKKDFDSVQEILKKEWLNTIANIDFYMEYASDGDYKDWGPANWEVLYPAKTEATYVEKHLKNIDIYTLLI